MSQALGHLAATVSLDINPFKASNNVLKAEIRSTANALRAQDLALKNSKNNLSNMRAVYATMTTQMRNYNEQMRRSKAIADDATKSDRARANAANQYNKTSAQVEVLQQRMQALSREITAQASRWGQAASRAQRFGNTLTTVGSKVQSVGRGMTAYLTTPIAAGLTYSAKKLVDFQDQMNRTKNVIRTSGESAAETSSSYKRMVSDARKYSDMYGVSQIKIAQGYQDLVKRGYTSKAAIGVMNNELKASIATGDDFNDVITVASQTMESFGLSTTKAGKPLKSARLMQERSAATLNKLAYAADATSTDFQSLGVGMSYVGATAHQAGFGLGETASAMGILSNNGLEADKAGTGLRKVIQSLITPTAGGAAALKKVNLSTKDFLTKSGKLKSMSSIFATLNKHMKGLTGSEKNDIFHALFGTTGQQAGAILTENANRLRELTKEVNNAGKKDYIGDLSKRNLDTPKAQLAIFKESLTNAGMDMAKNVLPTITPMVQGLSKLAQGFGKLSDPMKKAITSAVLFTAGAGPLLLLIGKLTSGAGGLALKFASVAGGISRARTAFGMGATGVQVLKSAFSKGSFETMKFGKTVATTGSQVANAKSAFDTASGAIGNTKTIVDATGKAMTATGLSTATTSVSLGTLALTAGVATAAIVGGVAVWELWGKQAVASAQRTDRWGSDVGAAADKALSKMKSTSTGIQSALTDMDVASHTSTKKMADDFDTEFSQMEQSAKKHFDNIKTSTKGLSPSVAAAVTSAAEKEKKTMNDLLADADNARVRANTILKTSNKNVSDLSDTQRVMLQNNQQQILNDELKMWNLTGNKRKAALAALNNDVRNMTRRQRTDAMSDLRESTQNMQDEYNKQNDILRKHYKKGDLTYKEYRAGLKQNEKTLKDYTSKAAAQYIKLARANGESNDAIKQEMAQMGMSYSQGAKELERQAKAAVKNAKSIAVSLDGLKGKTKSAAEMWNNLVFDPKTGKVRTNAQEEVNKAVNSSKQWNQIKLLAKKGKLSTNAGKMVAAALVANGKWDKMSWKEKKLYVKDNATQNVLKALEKSGEWNKLTMEQKEAIIKSKGQKDLANALLAAGAWNSLTLKQQEALIKDNATKPIYEALQKSGQWNNLTLKQQEAIINAKGKADLVDALVKAGAWNSLSLKQQEALVSAKGTDQVIEGINQMGKWNSLSPKQQQAIVNAKGGPALGDLITKYGLWKGMPASIAKQIIAQDQASGNLNAAKRAIDDWRNANPGAPKSALGVDNASAPFGNAASSVFGWNGINPNSKSAIGFDNASGPFGNARGSIFNWNGTQPNTKTANAKDNASGVISGALNWLSKWQNSNNNLTKTITTINKHVDEFISKHVKAENGLNYHNGGPLMVNDQQGSVFREMVQYPGEEPFIPFGRNVILNAPRGAKVVNARDTLHAFPKLPQYANGNSDAVSVLNNIKPVKNSTRVVNNYTSGSQPNNKYMNEVLDQLGNVADRLAMMLGQGDAQLSAIKASAFDKNDLYGTMGIDQVYLDAQRL